MPENQELVDKINILIRLMALDLCEGKSQKEQIVLLSNAGIGPKEIADMLGTTANTVSVTLAGARKAKKVRPSKSS